MNFISRRPIIMKGALSWSSRKISYKPPQRSWSLTHMAGRLFQLFVFITRWMVNKSLTLALQTSIIRVWSLFILSVCAEVMLLQHRGTLPQDALPSRQLTKLHFSLFPCVEVWLHHIHKVCGCSVSVAWHVHDGEGFAHSEEVHLLCVALKRKYKEGEMCSYTSWSLNKVRSYADIFSVTYLFFFNKTLLISFRYILNSWLLLHYWCVKPLTWIQPNPILGSYSMHGPVILYILGHIIHKHEIQHRCYADVQLTTSEDGNFHHYLVWVK